MRDLPFGLDHMKSVLGCGIPFSIAKIIALCVKTVKAHGKNIERRSRNPHRGRKSGRK